MKYEEVKFSNQFLFAQSNISEQKIRDLSFHNKMFRFQSQILSQKNFNLQKITESKINELQILSEIFEKKKKEICQLIEKNSELQKLNESQDNIIANMTSEKENLLINLQNLNCKFNFLLHQIESQISNLLPNTLSFHFKISQMKQEIIQLMINLDKEKKLHEKIASQSQERIRELTGENQILQNPINILNGVLSKTHNSNRKFHTNEMISSSRFRGFIPYITINVNENSKW
jgi:hypothetical protein